MSYLTSIEDRKNLNPTIGQKQSGDHLPKREPEMQHRAQLTLMSDILYDCQSFAKCYADMFVLIISIILLSFCDVFCCCRFYSGVI